MTRLLTKCAVVVLALSIFFSAGAVWASALRIGYYGGTFDPPTHGHHGLVERAILAAHLDVVYVMPSITNSHKPNATPYALRREMVRLAFADLPQVRTPDAEMEAAFQADRATGVLHLLLERNHGAHVLRITGDDVVSRNFNDELIRDPSLRNVGLIIGERGGENQKLSEDLARFNFAGRELIVLPVSTDQGYSSSIARGAIHVETGDSNIPVSADVLSFIRSERLYQNERHRVLTCESLLAAAS